MLTTRRSSALRTRRISPLASSLSQATVTVASVTPIDLASSPMRTGSRAPIFSMMWISVIEIVLPRPPAIVRSSILLMRPNTSTRKELSCSALAMPAPPFRQLIKLTKY